MYPINLILNDRFVLVVGGGHIALRKIKRLLKESCKITVMAPEVVDEIEDLARKKAVYWEKKFYSAEDSKNFSLVISCTGNQKVAEMISEESKKYHFLYNASDFPSLGNCTLPAHTEKGSIGISISTNGKSPAISKMLINRVKNAIPENMDRWLERVSVLRETLKTEIHDSKIREKFWAIVTEEKVMSLVESGKIDEAEEYLRHAISSIRVES